MTFNNPKEELALENTVGKGENDCNQHFSLFPTVFSTLSRKEIIILTTSILSSANAFNLHQAKILLFGNELQVTPEMISVYEMTGNIVKKKQNDGSQDLSFPNNTLQSLIDFLTNKVRNKETNE